MKPNYRKLLTGVALTSLCLFASCRSARESVSSWQLSNIEGSMITVDSTWDANPEAKSMAVLKPYKAQIDAMMYEVIGTSAMKMEKGAPESLLSNLVASVLQEATVPILGHPADMGLVNMGGLRNILPEGDITVSTVYEILPFENSLCILTLKGVDLKHLIEAIASLRGEGVSGVRIEVSSKGELLNASVGGKPIDENQLYTVATIDYLADGNGRMNALLQAEKRVCPEGATLRGLFLDYVRKQTAAGKVIASKLDGRVSVRE